MSIRLNKHLAILGVASRRKIDELITQHRITINNRPAVLGDQIDPAVDTIIVDKKIIPPVPNKLVFYAFNKPKYVLSSVIDDRHRKTIINFLPKTPRVFPVGRLDYRSTGLIIITNDGNLTYRLTHPRHHIPKIYLVTILGKVPHEKIIAMEKTGIKAEIVKHEYNQTIVKMTLYTGKKRQIRFLCADLRLYILDLHRTEIGPINLGQLKPGEYRMLTPREIKTLKT